MDQGGATVDRRGQIADVTAVPLDAGDAVEVHRHPVRADHRVSVGPQIRRDGPPQPTGHAGDR